MPRTEEAPLNQSRRIARTLAALAALLFAAACLDPSLPSSVCTQLVNYNLGDTASDSLSSQDCRQGNGAYADYYAFTTTGQENVRVNLSSPGMLTFLQLSDTRGAIVVNSALTTTLDTATTVRMMIGPGTYALAVNGVNPGQAGAYRLITSGDTAAVSGCVNVWVMPGVLTSQAISNADCTKGPAGSNYYYHLYTLVLLRAQEANLSLHSTAFPPEMVLTGPSGTFTSSPDSVGTTALISATVSTQGAYDLWVGSSSPAQFGTYTLEIR